MKSVKDLIRINPYISISELYSKLKSGRIHPLNILLNKINLTDQLIGPRTPRHNEKVERENRNVHKI